MPLANRTLSIRISGKQRKERISNLLYALAHFRNLLIIFNQIYQKEYGKWILSKSYLYALLSDKPYSPKGKEKKQKLKEFNEVLQNIEKSQELKNFLKQIKQQKRKVKNNYIIQTLIKQLVKDYKSFFKSLEKYKEHPYSFNGKPKLPRAKKLKDIPSFTVEINKNAFKLIKEIKKENGKKEEKLYILITLIYDKEKQYLKIKLPQDFNYEIKSVKLKFTAGDVYIDVVYKKEIKDINPSEKQHIAGIDIGLDNLLTIFSTNEDLQTLIDKLSRPIKLKLSKLFKVTCESLKEITGRKTNRAYCKVAGVNSFL